MFGSQALGPALGMDHGQAGSYRLSFGLVSINALALSNARFVGIPELSTRLPEQLGNTARSGASEAGGALVTGALEVDPVFASELEFACGPAVWNRVGATISSRLRELYGSVNDFCRALGLTGMLATGSGDFVDVLIPLMSSTDHNARFDVYDRYKTFHLGSLGDSWERIVSEWREQARVAFYSNIIHKSRPPQSLAAAALADPSAAFPGFRIAADVPPRSSIE